MPIVSHSNPGGRGAWPSSWGPFAERAAATNSRSSAGSPKRRDPHRDGCLQPGRPTAQKRKGGESSGNQTDSTCLSALSLPGAIADAMQARHAPDRAWFTPSRSWRRLQAVGWAPPPPGGGPRAPRQASVLGFVRFAPSGSRATFSRTGPREVLSDASAAAECQALPCTVRATQAAAVAPPDRRAASA